MYGQKGILYNETIWRAFKGTILVSVACALLAGSIGTMIGYAVSKNRRSRWANYVNSVAFLPYLMPSIAVGVAFFILFSTEKLNLFNTYTLLIIVGTVKYIPFASRSSLNSMLQLSGEIEEAAIIQDVPWIKRMTRIIIPIQKSSIISGFLLPFMTCLRELSLFMLLTQGLAREHRAAREPDVAAHQPQHDGDGLADRGQECEEGHQRPAPGEEPARPCQLFFAHAQPGDPLAFSQRADPVAAHAAQRVAQRCGCDAQYRVEPHVHEHDHHGFGAEREDAPGDECREEKSPISRRLHDRKG